MIDIHIYHYQGILIRIDTDISPLDNGIDRLHLDKYNNKSDITT